MFSTSFLPLLYSISLHVTYFIITIKRPCVLNLASETKIVYQRVKFIQSAYMYAANLSREENDEKALGLKVQYMHRVPSIRFHILEIVFAIIRSCFI